jgi:uncharacterized protein YbjT (DUF2867 family)
MSEFPQDPAQPKIIAVLGATGAQGGGLVRAMLAAPEDGLIPRAVTRDPSSAAAKALSDLGVEVVQADLDDQASLVAAFVGAHGAFCLTNYWEHFDTEKEKTQAANLAAAAKAAGVRHAVWSTLEDTRGWMSLSDTRMPTLQEHYKVPHMDTKGEANQYFVDSGVPTTFLITSFYWENMINLGLGPAAGPDGVLYLTFPLGDAPLPGIAVDDIGVCAHAIFRAGPEEIADTFGVVIGVAGAHLTGRQMADSLTDALGREVRYNAVSADTFRGFDFPGAEDMGNMFQFVAEFSADTLGARPLAATKLLNPALRGFDEWLAKNADRIPLG